jgi:hypothetical protein
MIANIQLDKPDFYFDVGSLSTHKEIYKILRDNGIRKMYAYAIMYRKNFLQYEFLKIGQSCPEPGNNTNEAVGERLGRQLAWGDGWGYPKPKSSHGIDFFLNIQEEINNGNLPSYLTDRKYWCVGVWDIDSRAGQALTFIRSEKDITEWVEGELAKQYKAQNMCLPILNYKDPTRNHSYANCNIDVKLFNSLFSYT